MDAHGTVTFRAGPTLLLARDELPDTMISYALEVLDHAHVVVLSVARIELYQSPAGVLRTLKAVGRFLLLSDSTLFDDARRAVVRLARTLGQTPVAPVLLPKEADTDPAVHPTGCDELGVDRRSR